MSISQSRGSELLLTASSGSLAVSVVLHGLRIDSIANARTLFCYRLQWKDIREGILFGMEGCRMCGGNIEFVLDRQVC